MKFIEVKMLMKIIIIKKYINALGRCCIRLYTLQDRIYSQRRKNILSDHDDFINKQFEAIQNRINKLDKEQRQDSS